MTRSTAHVPVPASTGPARNGAEGPHAKAVSRRNSPERERPVGRRETASVAHWGRADLLRWRRDR
jgi:hypothetical protein